MPIAKTRRQLWADYLQRVGNGTKPTYAVGGGSGGGGGSGIGAIRQPDEMVV